MPHSIVKLLIWIELYELRYTNKKNGESSGKVENQVHSYGIWYIKSIQIDDICHFLHKVVQSISLEKRVVCSILHELKHKKYLNWWHLSVSTQSGTKHIFGRQRNMYIPKEVGTQNVSKQILFVTFYIFGSDKRLRRWRTLFTFFVIICLINLISAKLYHSLQITCQSRWLTTFIIASAAMMKPTMLLVQCWLWILTLQTILE